MSGDSTPCNKHPIREETEQMRKTRAELDKMQGDIGERLAAKILVHEMDLNGEPFIPPYGGLDQVYRDRNGTLVTVECKFTTSGISSLNKGKHIPQGTPEHTRRNTRLMQDPTSSQFSPENAKLGAEIDRVGAENIRSMGVITDPGSLVTTVYELKGGNWQKLRSFDNLK